MLPLTSRERQTVLFLAGIFIVGLSLKLLFVLRPAVPRHFRVLDTAEYRPRVAVNRASYDELLAVPGIGPSTAGKIIRHRQRQGLLRGPDDLALALGRKAAEVRGFLPFLSFEAP